MLKLSHVSVAMAATVALVLTEQSSAFSVSSINRNTHFAESTHLYMSDEFPSDSSTEDIVEVESETVEPTPSEGLVTSIFDELPSATGGGPVGAVSKETRTKINEILFKLEAMNPTDAPASSPLLNGVWELKYAAGYDEEGALKSPTRQLALFLYSGGYSPGLFALSLASQLPKGLVEVGDLTIAISRDQPRIEAKTDVTLFGGASNSVVVKASLDTSSDIRLTETYESATVLDNAVDFPQAFQYSRDLYVTYLDEEVMVIRDGSGVPEILMRKQ